MPPVIRPVLSETASSYRLKFDPKNVKAEAIKAAIDSILHHVGCGSCGRLSVIDLHIAEKEVELPMKIEGLVSATELAK